jgi:hypothetical protein
MSTHATISIINEDQSVSSAYLHYDGYPSHTGGTLLKFFNNEGSVSELIHHGEIASIKLDGEVEPMRFLKTFKTFPDFNTFTDELDRQEFNYLFEDDTWYYATDDLIFKQL